MYALCKIHGSSAHVAWKDETLRFFAGGEKHEKFVSLFDPSLAEKFKALSHSTVTVYGEAYGGKCMGMSATYGKELKFVAFEVKIGDSWLSVPQAEDVVNQLGLEFVHYVKIPTTLEEIDAQRDADSVQAIRNGMGTGHKREGVILRPLIELTTNNGERIICKHKRDEFMETNSPREVDPEKLKILEEAQAIANEWVTMNRLQHVLDKMPNATGMENTRDVITAMIEDVKREAAGEVVWSKDAERAIGQATAKLFKQKISIIKV